MTKEMINRTREYTECLHVRPHAKSHMHYPFLRPLKVTSWPPVKILSRKDFWRKQSTLVFSPPNGYI